MAHGSGKPLSRCYIIRQNSGCWLFRVLLVFPATHPWSSSKSLSREEIRSQPFILYRRASMTTKLLEGYFRDMDIAPSTIMEVASIGAIKELVKLNLGV